MLGVYGRINFTLEFHPHLTKKGWVSFLSRWTGVKANLLPLGTFTPAFHIHCQFAVLPVVDDLPHYASLPGVFGGTDDVVAW